MASHTHAANGGVTSMGGKPSVDPTKNVLDLVDAANQRQDDLRHVTTWHLESMAVLRAEHAKEIRQLESDRLDKIRQVDQANVTTAAERALAAIQTLDRTTQANAETLRSMVANTATTIATQTDQRMAAVTERIAALEKTSYTGAGQRTVEDPRMAELLETVRGLSSSRASDVGQKQGLSDGWKMLIAALGAFALLQGLGVFDRTAEPTPQVIYTPAPAGTQLPTVPPGAVPR